MVFDTWLELHPLSQGGPLNGPMVSPWEEEGEISTLSFSNVLSKLLIIGDIFLSYESYLSPSLQYVLNEIKDNKKNASYFQIHSRPNEVSALKFSLTNVEIFLCEISDLIIFKSFNRVKKRNLLLPFSFHFGRKWYVVLSKKMDKLIETVKNDINFEKIIIRSSLNDNILMWDTMNFQIDLYKKHLEETKRLGSIKISSLGQLLNNKVEEEEKKDSGLLYVAGRTNHLIGSPIRLSSINLDESPTSNKSSYANVDQGGLNPSLMIIDKKDEPRSTYNIEEYIKEELTFQSNGIQIVIISSCNMIINIYV